MPSVKISPLFNDAQLDDNGLPLSGGLVNWYIAGTTTPVIIYSESSGSIANTNPVILNTRGEPVNPIWLQTGSAYKAILNDSLGNLIRTIDNISGVNDTSAPIISEWVLYSGAATYISGTSFSVVGDATATFDNGRRVKATVSGTDKYGTINGASVYAAGVTTVTLLLDSGVLDSSLATVYYGFLDPAHPSFDSTGVNTNTKSGIQSQTWTAFTTSGTSGVYTLTPIPAISAYTVNQRFNVTFNAASAATNTININGLGAKSLKAYGPTGVKAQTMFALNQVTDIVYDGTDFVIIDPIINMPVGSVVAFPLGTPPVGYLALPGAPTNISRTTYFALFAVLNTTWGAGDGSTTFGMPYCPTDYTIINNNTVAVLYPGEVIAHTHTYSKAIAGGQKPASTGTTPFENYTSDSTGSTGGAANFAAGIRMIYCIKY